MRTHTLPWYTSKFTPWFISEQGLTFFSGLLLALNTKPKRKKKIDQMPNCRASFFVKAFTYLADHKIVWWTGFHQKFSVLQKLKKIQTPFSIDFSLMCQFPMCRELLGTMQTFSLPPAFYCPRRALPYAFLECESESEHWFSFLYLLNDLTTTERMVRI